MLKPFNKEHLALARKAAAECTVLLKNDDNLLPLSKETKIALFGRNQTDTFKGGGGAADLWAVPVFPFADGLEEVGKVYAPLLKKYRDYSKANFDYALNKIHGSIKKYTFSLTEIPLSDNEVKTASQNAEVAICFIGRFAAEGFDVENKQGEYQITDKELEMLKKVSEYFEKVVLVLNLPGMFDLKFLKEVKISSILQTYMPGIDAGHAVADLIFGDVTPSGKLPDSWCEAIEHYPTNKDFGTEKIVYSEGIYMGYRYFDTFKKDVLFPFGFGLSYTEFNITPISQNVENSIVTVTLKVTNTGKFKGRETVQLYLSIPDGELENPEKILCGFEKTKTLSPNEAEELSIEFDLRDFAPYSKQKAAYILEKGEYLLQIGNSSRNLSPQCVILIDETVTVKQVSNRLTPPIEIKELKKPATVKSIYENIPVLKADVKPLIKTSVTKACNAKNAKNLTFTDLLQNNCTETDLVSKISDEELAKMLTGDYYPKCVAANIFPNTPIAEGEGTHTHPVKELGIPPTVMQDGPAGVRASSFTNPIPPAYEINGTDCICYPSATMLAASWDKELIREIGNAIVKDMERYNFNGLCAPGVNLHRNPLCGRNFEYFSEDPLLSAEMATYFIKGIQENFDGTPTKRYAVLKHFACNNSENKRLVGDSIVDERALRELYLKTFELVIKKANPFSVMTSYNMLNGIYTSASYELLTEILRNEWGYEGWVMTDWGVYDYCSAIDCVKAGSDTLMPGIYLSYEELKKAGIDRATMEKRAKNLIALLAKTN